MLNKTIYYQVIVRTSLIVGFALLGAYLFFKSKLILAILISLCIILQAYLLIQYLNSTNRKIAFFFECLKNDDFSLHFPERVKGDTVPELNQNINALNKRVQKIYQENKIQELYYQEILNQAEIGMLTFNEKGHILFANPRVEKLLNYSPLNHIRQLERVSPAMHELFTKLKGFDRKLIQLNNEREKTELVLKAKSVRLNDENLMLVVVQDIHQELDEKETDSWMKLIRVLTHEIMNSVSPITSISESVLKHLSNNGEVIDINEISNHKLQASIKGLEVIKDQSQGLMNFVESYRTFLNVPPPNKTLVSAKDLLEKIQILQKGINEKIEISILIDPKELEIYCDEKQITQVLINLSKNAIQALSSQVDGQIKLIAKQNSNGLKSIQVWDNGPSIPISLQEEIFIPFFTTKETGTGVGLSLSRHIMRQHGGSLKLYASEKDGNNFQLDF
jgi:nitrogen fixation/metabolism regulation signal transduction histidine kinase